MTTSFDRLEKIATSFGISGYGSGDVAPISLGYGSALAVRHCMQSGKYAGAKFASMLEGAIEHIARGTLEHIGERPPLSQDRAKRIEQVARLVRDIDFEARANEGTIAFIVPRQPEIYRRRRDAITALDLAILGLPIPPELLATAEGK